MRKPKHKTITKALFFTIGLDKKLSACEITLNGNFTDEQVQEYLQKEYPESSENKFFLLFDVVWTF